MLPFVAGMLCDRSLRPGLGTLRRIILRRIADEVDSEFTPDDQFVEIAVARSLELGICLYRGLHSKRNRNRTHVSEVQIGRQAGGPIRLRTIALPVIVFK